MTSWKTSLVGALVIIAASLAMAFGGLDTTAGGLLVTVGVGLILARDDKGGGAPPAAPAADVPKAPTVPPVVGGLLVGSFVGFLIVVTPLSVAGCTPAAQATAAQVGGAALAAVDGPGCELVEVRSGSALAGVLCSAAAGALEGLLASAAKAAPAGDAVPRARVVGAPPARCHLVPVHAGGAHVGFACEEHAAALVAALARDGGA